MRKWNKWILVLIAIIFGLSFWYVFPESSRGTANRNLMLAPSDGTISGVVNDLSTKQPVAGLEVKLIKENQAPLNILTDESGKFMFSTLARGSYQVEIDRTDHDSITYPVDIESGEQVSLTFSSIPSTMSIKGDVSDTLSREPIEGVVVAIQQPSGTEAALNVTTDALGRFGFSASTPGTYTLTLTDSDYETAEPVSVEYTTAQITKSFQMQPKPAQISGGVTTLAGTVLSGATVVLTKDGNQIAGNTTDAEGFYSFTGIAPGDYTLITNQGTYLEKRLSLKVAANATVQQNVSLSPPNVSLEGQVLNSANQTPLAGATITIGRTPKDNETAEVLYTTLTDEQGYYVLGGMPRGMSLIITASKSGYKNIVRSSTKISFSNEGFHFGLDLKGGSQIVLKADFEAGNIADEDKSSAIKGAIDIIERRISGYGVSDPVIQKVGSDRILVELPGIKNTDEAVNLIGQIAKLDFREPVLDAQGNVVYKNGIPEFQTSPAAGTVNGQQIELTGAYFKGNVQVQLDQNHKPEVAFEWKEGAADVFEQVTGRLVNGNKPLGIFLDNKLISYPSVQAVIKDKGVITGLSLNEAKNLVTQLKSGALPVPLQVVERHDVDPTLGPNVIKKCLIAGALGLLAVLLFMTMYYRLPGLLSGGALIVYAAVVLAIFKVIPVTLTLAGIGGFIVSIGMAVDANCIIFERLKEELRAGRALEPATDIAFNRAWPAIRDSNFTTFIACGILYWLGSTLGVHPVQGFAITLFFGVAMSMISAIIMTHAFVRGIISRSWANKPWLYLGMGEKSNV